MIAAAIPVTPVELDLLRKQRGESFATALIEAGVIVEQNMEELRV